MIRIISSLHLHRHRRRTMVEIGQGDGADSAACDIVAEQRGADTLNLYDERVLWVAFGDESGFRVVDSPRTGGRRVLVTAPAERKLQAAVHVHGESPVRRT